MASQHGKVVGVTMVEPSACVGDSLFAGTVGTIGSVGVAAFARSQGIGLALAARATGILNEQNLDFAYLSWTSLAGWYVQVG